MQWKSEKEIYASELDEAALRFPAEYFVWGEELFDRALIVYPGKLKAIAGYEEFKEYIKPCGLVLVDRKKDRQIRCIPASLDVRNGNLYLPENVFNAVWKCLKTSVDLGLRMAREKRLPDVADRAEEIVDLTHLLRTGSAPQIRENTICYLPRSRTEAEQRWESKKQSLLDNPRMNYYYASAGGYCHDKECEAVRHILPEQFCGSVELPAGRELCPKCRRKIYFRKACAPNTKQMAVCDRIFQNHQVSMNRIRHCVMDVGMKFHAVTLDEVTIEKGEDTWIVKGTAGKELQLWHNNYVRISGTERYITEGFHNQGLIGFSLSQILAYIEGYTWEKHLQGEAARRIAAAEEEQGRIDVETPEVAAGAETLTEEQERIRDRSGGARTWRERIRAWIEKIRNL